MDTAIKVAFASTDRTNVNQHFGSAKSFVVYLVNKDEAKLLEVMQFEETQQDGNEDKLMAKIELLQGCAAVYCQAIGASAIRKLLCCNIQPMKVYEGCKISTLVEELQQELSLTPSVWLAKALKKQQEQQADRFSEMEQEQWQE